MRWFVILSTLIMMLLALFQLSRLMDDWHYVLPAPEGELLYVATFDDAEDWDQDQSLNLNSEVIDGVMRVSVEAVQNGLFTAPVAYFRNFDMTVETRVQDGLFTADSADGYGIIFRQLDHANYYVFYINNDGVYRIGRLLDNQLVFLSDWVDTEAINPEIGNVNRLRVVGYEDRFQFYINDELLELCIPNDPDAYSTMFNGECLEGTMQTVLVDDSINYGRLGVAVAVELQTQEVSLIVDFDNVVVYGAEPIIDDQ